MTTQDLPFSLIGACFGAGGRSATIGEAPQALRQAGLIQHLQAIAPNLIDRGDRSPDFFFQVTKELGGVNCRDAIVRYLQFLADEIFKETEQGRVPLMIGGDHSNSIASVSATATSLRKRKGPQAKLGLLWVDTHADINTPASSLSGNAHGMTVATLLGMGDPALTCLCSPGPKIAHDSLVYVALRDIDPFERKYIQESGILAFSMKEIDRYGLAYVMEQALDRVTAATDGFAFSFDLDVCDPVVFPSVSLPVRGGLTYRESHLVMEMVAERDHLLEMSMCEFDPVLDTDGSAAQIALSLLESAVGKTVLA